MKQTKFEGIHRDIYDMSQMVDQMVATTAKGPNLTETYHAIAKDILDVTQKGKTDMFKISKKLPVNYVEDHDARKLDMSLQVEQFTSKFRIPKYSPVKFERLSKGKSTVTPRKEVVQQQPNEGDELKSGGLFFVEEIRATRINDESAHTPRKDSEMEPEAKNAVNLLNM